jgi:hypothetical protein
VTSVAALGRTGRIAARSLPSPGALPAIVAVGGAIVGLGATNGGYFPTSWGWSALVFSWSALLALLVKSRIALSRLELAFLSTFSALLAWSALSLLWTSSTTATMYEVERTLVYVTFAAAVPLVVTRAHVQAVLGSMLVAVTALCFYGLATRLLPGRLTRYDPITAYRLSEPLGYWNAVAALSAFGCILAVGLAAKTRSPIACGLSAASLVVLVPTLYFTFGRGGWLALLLGLAALIAIDAKRLQLTTTLLLVAPWPALGVWRSYESKGMTTDFSPLNRAANDGERLAWTLAIFAAVAFACTALVAQASARVPVGPRLRRAWAALLVVVALGGVGTAVVAYGGPSEITTRALHSIRKPSPNVRGDQTRRLFSLSGNGRLETWSSALDDARAHPILGSGAGSFEQWWLRHRARVLNVKDAHSLFVETAGELGVVGLGLLLLAVAFPVVAAVGARSQPYVPVAFGGFVAFVAHAAVDWDWEMPAVTVCGLAFAACILACARDGGGLRELGRRGRAAAASVLLVASAFAFVSMTGNRALGQADRAADRADPAAAAKYARRAARWAPWSSEPVRLEADAALESGAVAEARRLYAKAIAKDPQNWELWLGLALASDGQGRQTALAHAAELNSLDPGIRQLRAPRV